MPVLVTRHVLDQVDLIDIESEKLGENPLLEVIRPIGMTSTFSKYYVDDGCLLLNNIFPYMLIDGRLKWNVPYEQVMLDDFLATHPKCLQDGIDYETGLPAAGGHERVIGVVAVNIIISILRSKYSDMGLLLDVVQIVISALGELAQYYEKKEISVIQQLDAIISTGECGVLAIQELLDFDEYHARKLLLALGFIMDEETRKYVMGTKKRAETRAMLDKLEDEELKWFS